MSREYRTTPTMLIDRFSETVVQPDANLINQLHRFLDFLPDDNMALGIDYIVEQLIRFHNPSRQKMDELILPESQPPAQSERREER